MHAPRTIQLVAAFIENLRSDHEGTKTLFALSPHTSLSEEEAKQYSKALQFASRSPFSNLTSSHLAESTISCP
jgi:hypothetical protein